MTDDSGYTGDHDYDAVFGQLMSSMTLAPAVQAAAKLRIADAIGDEPVPITELAADLDVQVDALDRLMAALSAFGVFRAAEGGYGHSPVSRVLRADAPDTVLHLILMSGSEWNTRSWYHLADTVRTGVPAFRTLFGKDIFDYFAENDQESAAHYHRAMTVLNSMTSRTIADGLDLKSAGTIADIGGGQGALLRAVLEQHPKLKGVLFDIEQVTKDADPELVAGSLADRCEVISGDAHVAIPVVADVYLLKHVLHMWSDEDCVRVLRNIAAAATPGARVILAEQVLTDDPSAAYTRLMDLQMLATVYGRERTETEFARLFEKANLHYTGMTMNSSMISFLEGTT